MSFVEPDRRYRRTFLAQGIFQYNFEIGGLIAAPTNPLAIATYRRMRDALEARGIVFIYAARGHGEGVMLKD